MRKAIGVVAFALVAPGLLGLALVGDEPGRGLKCPKGTGPPVAPEQRPQEALATLEPEDPAGVRIRFGRSRTPKVAEFFLGLSEKSEGVLPEAPALIQSQKRPLRRDEVDGAIGSGEYSATLRVSGRRQATLTICIDPAKHNLHPGTYRGSVLTDDPRVEDVAVPVTVTLQYPRWRWVAVLFGVTVLVSGSFFVWSSSSRARDLAAGTAPAVAQQPFVEWLGWVPRSLVSIAVGAVAAGSVFTATYLRDPGWGAEAPSEWLTLLAAMFTAFTAGLTGGRASLELPKRGAGTGGQQQPQGQQPQEQPQVKQPQVQQPQEQQPQEQQ